MTTRRGELLLDGWAGRRAYPVDVIGETPKRYRVRLLEDMPLPGRNQRGAAGDVRLVPKHAVRFGEAAATDPNASPADRWGELGERMRQADPEDQTIICDMVDRLISRLEDRASA